MEIVFNFEKRIALLHRTELKHFITKLFNQEKVPAISLGYVFCSDDFLLQMNKDYLQHDYYTDIITFDLSDSKHSPIIGEVYISVDTVKSNAAKFNTTAAHELHRVIFHGALHLCGYKDKSKNEKVLMTKKEDQYLKEYFSIFNI